MAEGTNFRHVIIGLDGASGGRDAFVLLGRLAPEATRVDLVVVEVRDPLSARRVGGSVAAGAEHQGEQFAAELARQAVGGEVRTRAVTATSVAAGLRSAAAAPGADLIIVGSSTRGAPASVLLGDDCRELLRHPPCCVAVACAGLADQPRAQLSVIGVGQGSDSASLRALAMARSLRLPDGHVRVARVVSTPLLSPDPASAATALLLHRVDVGAVRAERTPEPAADLTDVDDIMAGSVRRGLLELADHVDLMVVGLHDRSPVGRLLHGRTTAESLMREIPCSLLGVPAERSALPLSA